MLKFSKTERKIEFSYAQTIALGFLVVIFLGTFLLSLPISSKNGQWTGFFDALFTATSATCVTGLVVFDTFSYWTLFGQIVILALIQIGGIGFMTVLAMFFVVLKRKIGINERQLLVQTTGVLKNAGIVKFVKRIVLGSFCFELAGAVLLAFSFCPKFGFVKGMYFALFHSVSAFCNAGFDLMGQNGQFLSLTGFENDIIVNITITMLVVVGGIGFMVWGDILTHKFRFSRYSLHTKIVLSTTAALITTAWILFFLIESHGIYANFSLGEQILASLFQAVSPRSAGFYTTDISHLSDSACMLTIVLMLIGGSSGSTAGGIKTTTFAILVLNAISSSRRKRNIMVFKRKIDDQTVKQATSLFFIYLAVISICTIVICAIEPFAFLEIAFEVVSAISTSGMSMGITPFLTPLSLGIVGMLMFVGRVGCLTLVIALAKKQFEPPVERLTEKIAIG